MPSVVRRHDEPPITHRTYTRDTDFCKDLCEQSLRRFRGAEFYAAERLELLRVRGTQRGLLAVGGERAEGGIVRSR
jgi:hypothetical protein